MLNLRFNIWLSKNTLLGDLPTNTWELGNTHAEVKAAFFTVQAAIETRKGLVRWLKEELGLRNDQATVYHRNAVICVDAYAYPVGLCCFDSSVRKRSVLFAYL